MNDFSFFFSVIIIRIPGSGIPPGCVPPPFLLTLSSNLTASHPGNQHTQSNTHSEQHCSNKSFRMNVTAKLERNAAVWF